MFFCQLLFLNQRKRKNGRMDIFFTKECAGCGGRWRVLLQQFIGDGLTTDRANAPGHFLHPILSHKPSSIVLKASKWL